MELYRKLTILLNELQEMILQFRMQNFNRGERLFSAWTGKYGEALGELLKLKEEVPIDEAVIMQELQGLLQAMEQKDYVLMADLMQLQTAPFLESVLLVLRELNGGDPCENEVVEGERIYRLEPTSSGNITMSITDSEGTYYLHSNASPIQEADLLALQYYEDGATGYIVYGLGLGYHVLSLCKYSHGLTPIRVYESDSRVIELAGKVCDFSAYEGRCLQIIEDRDLSQFAAAVSESVSQSDNNQSESQGHVVTIIHYPSIRNVRNESVRERLLQMFVQDSSIRNQIGEMLANFRGNVRNCKHEIDELEPQFRGRDVILVAAGPSLDKNVELLRGIDRNDERHPIVICVGTAFRKLMGMGIVPDYVIFLDASERIRGQISGVENASVPALIVSSSTMRIAEDYCGDKYLVCQKGFDEAVRYAEKRGLRTYESGGSVSTIVMDIANQLGASRFIAIGLDLAYTNRQYHANGAGRCSQIDSMDGLVQVTSVDGGLLYTTQAMKMYIDWFENYLKEHRDSSTEFIDATEGGALIRGMKREALAHLCFLC